MTKQPSAGIVAAIAFSLVSMKALATVLLCCLIQGICIDALLVGRGGGPLKTSARSLSFFYNQRYRTQDLWDAIDEKNSVLFQEMLECRCVYLDERDDSGNTALLRALNAQNETMALALVNAGADVNAKNNRLFTPLHVSCRYGFMNVTRLMLELGADVNAETVLLERPITYAAGLNNKAMLQLLISYGAEINFIDVHGDTLLHSAAAYGALEDAEFLVDRGANLTVRRNGGETAAQFICACLEFDEREFNTCAPGRCTEKDIRALQEFFEKAGKRRNAVSNDGKTDLDMWIAVSTGTYNDVENVLDCNCTNPETGEQIPNCRCVELQAVTQVETRHWDKGQTALHLAVLRKHLAICRLLIENGARADFRNGDGDTPLHLATKDNSTAIVELFLAQGISADGQNNEGQTALHIASRYGFLHVSRLLVDHGAALNINDEQGATPVEIVCSCLLLGDCPQGACSDADDIVKLMTALREEDSEDHERMIQLFFPPHSGSRDFQNESFSDHEDTASSLGTFVGVLFACTFGFFMFFAVTICVMKKRQAHEEKMAQLAHVLSQASTSTSHAGAIN